MFNRIIKSALIGIVVLYILPLQASPIGLYIRPSFIPYWGGNKKKQENFAGAINIAYQWNRNQIWELSWTLPWMIKDEDVKHAVTATFKSVIPLKYYLNIYCQGGASWKNDNNLGIHAPFVGLGFTYHVKRKWHIDVSWRNYRLLGKDGPGYSSHRKNAATVGVGYHLR